MATLVIERKVDTLRRCLGRIRAKRPESVEALEADPDLQDILVLNLNRAIQLCVDVALQILADRGEPTPGGMADAFRQLGQMRLLDRALVDPPNSLVTPPSATLFSCV